MKKLLLSLLCLYSVDVFANTYYVHVHNNTGRTVSMNYEEVGSQDWTGSFGDVEGIHEMTSDKNHLIYSGTEDISATRSHNGIKYFSITVPSLDKDDKGRKTIFFLKGGKELDCQACYPHEISTLGIGANYITQNNSISLSVAGKYTYHTIDIFLAVNNSILIETYTNRTNIDSKDPRCKPNDFGDKYNSCMGPDAPLFRSNLLDLNGFDIDLQKPSGSYAQTCRRQDNEGVEWDGVAGILREKCQYSTDWMKPAEWNNTTLNYGEKCNKGSTVSNINGTLVCDSPKNDNAKSIQSIAKMSTFFWNK